MSNGHTGHAAHDMPRARCSMNMLWNYQIVDTCIVFRSWHVSSTTSFVLSFFAIVAIGVFYEWLRSYQKVVDRKIVAVESKGKVRSGASRDASRERTQEDVSLLGKGSNGISISPLSRIIRAVLYATTVFISFFLMLVFMTYNAYLILAVVAGAGIGHYFFADISVDGDSKGMACH